MSAGTAAARRTKRKARLASVPAEPKKSKKRKGKAEKRKKLKLGKAMLLALRGQTPPEQLVGEAGEAAELVVPNPRLRWAFYNGSAAAVGHVGMWAVTGDPWAGAEVMSQVMGALPNWGAFVVTLGAGYGAYRVVRPLKALLGPVAPVAPFGAAVGAAFWGQGTAELIADFLAWSAPWSDLMAPLIVAGGASALCWFLLESRASKWPRPFRWLARIPLATVVVSSLLYGPGALL